MGAEVDIALNTQKLYGILEVTNCTSHRNSMFIKSFCTRVCDDNRKCPYKFRLCFKLAVNFVTGLYPI
jgi:hypothetical protein